LLLFRTAPKGGTKKDSFYTRERYGSSEGERFGANQIVRARSFKGKEQDGWRSDKRCSKRGVITTHAKGRRTRRRHAKLKIFYIQGGGEEKKLARRQEPQDVEIANLVKSTDARQSTKMEKMRNGSYNDSTQREECPNLGGT